uniref:Uncharacterized protein n=1 Tax=Anguilla anguilla TaxID=7936 RepID=A0A0E9UZC8_ANGAN
MTTLKPPRRCATVWRRLHPNTPSSAWT